MFGLLLLIFWCASTLGDSGPVQRETCQSNSSDALSALSLKAIHRSRNRNAQYSTDDDYTSGCATEYGGCNCGPCCETFEDMGCTNYNDDSAMAFFELDGVIYGTVAAGTPGSTTEWTTCGACYETVLGPNCSTVDWSSGVGVCEVAPSDWGCQATDASVLGSEGTTVYVMVTNQCSECYTGHFDICNDDDYGNATSLIGMDNPSLTYKSVDCPAPLLERLGCPTTSGSCTSSNKDRYWPNLGGCCSGLKECVEQRPTSNPVWCHPHDPQNGKSCWSHIVMCREDCKD